jgi:RNA polymerase sigma-70 factor (ECF subfamily)
MRHIAPQSAYGSRTGFVAFDSTAWSVVAGAQAGDRDLQRQCCEYLIERYWPPVYAFVRQRGNAHEDAKDLVQGFFADFLERRIVSYADRRRGRFRSFLLASIKQYMAQQHRRSGRRPQVVSLPDLDPKKCECAFAIEPDGDPERAFMRNWAKCVLENSIARFREECAALDKERLYEVFAARYLVNGEGAKSYKEIAAATGSTEVDVGKLLQRARVRLSRIVREELGNGSCGLEDAEEESL